MEETGAVSYVSSQNVYVKFSNTVRIEVGDTLYITSGTDLKPALVVTAKSSISCIGTALSSAKLGVSQKVVARKVVRKKIAESLPDEMSLDTDTLALPGSTPQTATPLLTGETGSQGRPASFREDKSFQLPSKVPSKSAVVDDVKKQQAKPDVFFKEKIRGRISLGTYSTVSGTRTNHRMRYAFSLRGDHLKDSKWSVESYITLRHSLDEWQELKENLNDALKIYSLAIKYDFDHHTSVTVGRKINPRISNMGAIDGLQFEKQKGNFRLGAIIGSRPDYENYGLNLELLQFGGYVSLGSGNNAKYHQTTVGFIEQRNHSNIDRRFVYFQHSSRLLDNLNLFSSMEMSLYEKIHEEVKNKLSLTNLYVSLRYRLSKKLNFSASYDNRKNIIYYESYKSFIDQLIEDETRQGVRLHVNYKPFKYVNWGVNTGWRFQKNDENLSKSLNSYLTFSKISDLNIRATFTANLLQTNYLQSKIFGVRVYKDLLKGKISGDLNYRWVDYKFQDYENPTLQHVGGISLSMRVFNKLTFYMYYEGTFDSVNPINHRVNTKIIYRF